MDAGLVRVPVMMEIGRMAVVEIVSRWIGVITGRNVMMSFHDDWGGIGWLCGNRSRPRHASLLQGRNDRFTYALLVQHDDVRDLQPSLDAVLPQLADDDGVAHSVVAHRHHIRDRNCPRCLDHLLMMPIA